MSLEKEIKAGARTVATDSYDISVGELINIYRDGELVVNPEFQRLFRWTLYQKSHFIESLLIGIPIPSIFVFEKSGGAWELIDGLQRISTILEFVGILKKGQSTLLAPSVLAATRTLPSLQGMTWQELGSAQQIAIKRARIGVQILKKASDDRAKYDLFQRLNSHGSEANAQELRNCVIVMLNPKLHREMKRAAGEAQFKKIMQPSARAAEKQAMMDYLTRFLVFMFVEYDKKWDVEEYLNNGIIEIASDDSHSIGVTLSIFDETLELLASTGEPNILKRYSDGKFSGKVGQAGFEAVFLGVAANREFIGSRDNPASYILERVKSLWAQPQVGEFTKGGVTGTTRLQSTLPFGKQWFSR